MFGKILEIDLKDHSFKEISYEKELVPSFLGGTGFGIEYLMKNKVYEYEPLSENNPLAIMMGLLLI